ncbi:MAG: hypothetical protein ACR2QO_21965 [Acidimicrobiales bacterium]
MTALTEILQMPAQSVNGRQLAYLGTLTSILVNIVVLNLFVEFADKVVIDSFTISIFTAVLLSAMLYVITRFEHHISDFFFEQHDGRAWRVAGVVAVWGVLFGSKFVILEIVDLVFGDHVELGKLIEVILIVVVMLVAKALVAKGFKALGDRPADNPV